MKKKHLALAITLALSASAIAGQDDWRADPNYDPAYGKLAAPRTENHPIDQMVWMAEYGMEAAQETLAEWEADPAQRDRLHQRKAYRDYKQRQAAERLEERLAKAEALEAAAGQESKVESPNAVSEASQAPSSSPTPTKAAESPETPQVAKMHLDAELKQLRATVETVTAERDELAEKLAALEKKYAQLQVAHKNLQAEHGELQVAHQRLQSEHEELQVAHEALRSNHQQVVAENEHLKKQFAELQGRFDSLKARNERLLAGRAMQPGSLEESKAMVKPIRPDEPNPDSEKSSKVAANREEVDTDASLAAIKNQGEASERAVNLNERGLEALDHNDPAAALGWFLRAARSGSTNAMNNLGYLYEKGWGALPSAQEAIRWYERAAERGHVHAMRNVARFYEHGIGVLADAERAGYWRDQADQAEQRKKELARADVPEGQQG